MHTIELFNNEDTFLKIHLRHESQKCRNTYTVQLAGSGTLSALPGCGITNASNGACFKKIFITPTTILRTSFIDGSKFFLRITLVIYFVVAGVGNAGDQFF